MQRATYQFEKLRVVALIDADRKERKRLADRLDKIRLELCISHKANEKTTTGKKDCKEGNCCHKPHNVKDVSK